ncbi:transcription termination factor NusA [Cyanobacterium aponinum AL20118]|uniref:Transcription termination factor NusA n=2 Tax=Cyanobacterium aponinum TaxID=379064 RepID=K9YZU1_CYAAP|nr:hypothetical protein Cyan10605_0285 [Cyanobacterium aponinum PCC 10605]PHV61476.1 transcription termination factor NusA [Cyanobacterium aponinum IPPAS B-1201]
MLEYKNNFKGYFKLLGGNLMTQDIDVDIDELKEFIDTLQYFQDVMSDRFQAVEYDWNRCDESWEGESKKRFTSDFEEVYDRTKRTLTAGEDALEWLKKYYQILEDFERF